METEYSNEAEIGLHVEKEKVEETEKHRARDISAQIWLHSHTIT